MSKLNPHETVCNRTFDVGLSVDSYHVVVIRFGDDMQALTLEMAEVLAIQLLRAVQYRRESIRINANFNVGEEIEQLQPADFESARADASFLRHQQQVQSRAYERKAYSTTKDAPGEN